MESANSYVHYSQQCLNSSTISSCLLIDKIHSSGLNGL